VQRKLQWVRAGRVNVFAVRDGLRGYLVCSTGHLMARSTEYSVPIPNCEWLL
jgi:hypothetical protein